MLKQHGLPDVRRQHLQQAQVIGRVDRKFILVKVPSGGGSEDEAVLGLIDQHAADERIHVETLFRELCRRLDGGPTAVPFTSKLGHEAGTAVVILDQATVVEVVEYESRSLRERAAHLARWGLMFDMDRGESGGEEWPEGSGRGQVTVRALPAGVAARCYVEPEGIVKMLRAEAGAGSAPKARATPHAAPGETQDVAAGDARLSPRDHRDAPGAGMRRLGAETRAVRAAGAVCARSTLSGRAGESGSARDAAAWRSSTRG